MTTQNMVPCISGKCGVKSHIVGSLDQKRCGTNPGHQFPAPQNKDMTPRTTTGKPKNEIAAQQFLQDSYAQQEAMNERVREQVMGSRNPIKRLWQKIRYTDRQRADMAWKAYEDTGVEDRLQRSFLNFLSAAQNARPTPRTGEPVVPLDNFRNTQYGGSYGNIKYVHHAGAHPRVEAIQTTSRGPRKISVRYENEGMTLKVMDPQSGKELLTESHDYMSIAARKSADSDTADYHREASQSLMDLLVHVQNEKNWVNG